MFCTSLLSLPYRTFIQNAQRQINQMPVPSMSYQLKTKSNFYNIISTTNCIRKLQLVAIIALVYL